MIDVARTKHCALGFSLIVLSGACNGYRPARFADRPLVTRVDDEQPIPLPSRTAYDEQTHLSDVYLRRPLFDVVRPLDFSTGGDVNALDEVPLSSWYDPAQSAPPADASTPHAPQLPLIATDDAPVTHEDALVVRDARGSHYELLVDPDDHPGLRTGAEVIGGILLRDLGLRAPRSWLVSVPEADLANDASKGAQERLVRWLKRKTTLTDGARRVSATFWPDGIDVGVGQDFGTRDDDPNDHVDHQNRRTLRALRIFAHWIGWSSFDVESTRDVYVGAPPSGHLLHYLIGTSRAFGTSELQPHDVLDEDAGSEWYRFLTLGLSKPVVRAARRAPFPSLGFLPETLVPGDFSVSPPYSPFVRLTAADEYWAGKRLIDIGEDAVRAAVAAAALPDDATALLERVLLARRRTLIEHALGVVSPIDTVANVGRSVWIRDRAIGAGFALPASTSYEVAFLDTDGAELAPRRRIAAAGELSVVALPGQLLFGTVVLHLRAVRDGVPSPRWCDVHVLADRSSARIIGVRH